ncbi:unnamed protein product [Prunus armeniaca]|nr:hypothetical protein GBA52_020460 [Prunus armeniaca]
MNGFGGKEACKGKSSKRKDKQGVKPEGEDKNYFQWNIAMERELADILREERSLGHKGDGGWKAIAYNTTVNILAAQFNLQISADNIRNRVKS